MNAFQNITTHWVLNFLLLKVCIQGYRRIANGVDVIPGELPYQVAIKYDNGKDFCSGIIVAPSIIITAAHCFKRQLKNGTIEHRDQTMWDYFRVLAGKQTGVISNIQERRFKDKPTIHEGYNYFMNDHDIAMILLETPFEFTSYITNVRLPDESMDSRSFSDNYTVSGWGYDPALGRVSTILKRTTVKRYEDKVCFSKLNDTFKSYSMLCAGAYNSDACQGDSGGPLTCYHKHKPEKTFVCGIVSFGSSDDLNEVSLSPCGLHAEVFPGVYTDTSKHHKWVLTSICKLSRHENLTCGSTNNYFQCCNKVCVRHSDLCDGFKDCWDGSDEHHCDKKKIPHPNCSTQDVCPKQEPL